MLEINALRQTSLALVKMMALKNVRVEFRGREAYTLFDTKTGKPTLIVLPVLNDDVDPEIVNAFRGYLDHEVAHVLFSEVNKPRAKQGLMLVFNALEDPRVEALLVKKFVGSATNLNALYRQVFRDEDWLAMTHPALSPSQRNLNRLIRVARALAGQPYFEALVNLREDLVAMRDALVAQFGLDVFQTMTSSADAWNLAEKIYKFLAIQESELPPEARAHCPQGKAILDKHMTPHLEKAMEWVVSAGQGLYQVYSTAEDSLIVPEGSRPYLDEEDNIRAATSSLRARLSRLFKARSRVVWASGFKSGRLSAGSLYKLRFQDPKVFARKQIAQSKSIAVSLVVDFSGSMEERIESAMASAFVMASVLEDLGIRVEILGFTTHGYSNPALTLTDEERLSYARLTPLKLYLLKKANEPLGTSTKARMNAAQKNMYHNVDGESLLIAYHRLMTRPEAKKILFVLSDGCPEADGNQALLAQHLKNVVTEIEKHIDLYALGIQSDAPQTFYSNFVRIDELKDLETHLIQMVATHLLPAKTRVRAGLGEVKTTKPLTCDTSDSTSPD